ncbi:MAG TPA: ferrochelatase [Anaerolineales bacterium]
MSPRVVGVLLMAYGSPESVDDLGPYLLDIRGGRATPEALVEEIKDRYRQIGGRSPLLDITRRQAAGLEAELNRRYAGQEVSFRCYVGMRHWEPRIREAVAQMVADCLRECIGLVMAPHSSRLSTGAYFTRLDEAVAGLGVPLHVTRIESWHAEPGLITAIAEQAGQALARFDGERPYVIFSAHSLPRRILEQGDPYADQLHETASLLAERLGLAEGRWCFSYQSAGQSAEPWLGPPIEQVVVDLARSGECDILVTPVGFVCDHVEVLYDVDIRCRKLAAENGARLERSPSLNNSPAFISALADIVSAHC